MIGMFPVNGESTPGFYRYQAVSQECTKHETKKERRRRNGAEECHNLGGNIKVCAQDRSLHNTC